MSSKRRKNRPPSVVLSQSTTALKQCPGCGATEKPWQYSTNGDGSTAQCCTQCGTCYPMGRYFQDASVGVRMIHFSWWSALHHERKPE